MDRHRYCVIGAGAAGLAATAVLVEQGFDVVCVERSHRVGGHWHTDYESLHLITSRDVSGFEGFPMPDHYPTYPSRDQIRDYLESFSARFRLREHIRFGVDVARLESVGRAGAQGWIVEANDGSREQFSAVLVANGHLWEANTPSYPGRFTGQAIHSSQYKNLADIEGTRVLTVGAGNSGCDLAVDMANARLESFISLRHGQMFLPKAIFGKPRAEIGWLARLPPVLQERVSRALVDVVIGPTSAYRGLPEPATRNLNKQPPVVNNLLLYWIHHGRITVLPAISRFEGKVVHFTDGTKQEFDTLLWATGFKVSLPFLDHSLLTWRDGVPLRTAGLTLPVGVENLYLIGLAAPRGPQLPVYSGQAKLVARMLRLSARGSSGMSARFAKIDRPDRRIDILRPIWMRNMERAHKTLDALERTQAAPVNDRFVGRVALISGGARGQGASHAERLAAEAASVVCGDVLDDEGEATAARICAKGFDVWSRHLDVTSPTDWAAVVDEVRQRYGRLDVLVNNAGIIHVNPLTDETLETWNRTLAVNTTGVLLGMQAAVPLLRSTGGGAIVNVASIFGVAGAEGYIAYCASKGAIIAMTKTAALELAVDRIRVNTICPGGVNTPMNEQEPDGGVVPFTPLGRRADVSEISAAVAFLASDDAIFVTGSELVIDGGYLAR